MADNLQLKVRENGPVAWEWQIVDQNGKSIEEGTEFSREAAESAGRFTLKLLSPPGDWEDVEE